MVALIIVGVVYALVSNGTTEEPTSEELARAEVIEQIDREPSEHDHAGHDHADEAKEPELRGNPDRPVGGPGRDNVENRPPLNDAEAWKQRRMDQARELHEGQVAAARAYGSSQGLSDEQTEAVVTAVDALHTELRAIKLRIEEGTAAPAELREAAPGLRAACASAVETAVGHEHTAGIRAWLKKDALGGGF